VIGTEFAGCRTSAARRRWLWLLVVTLGPVLLADRFGKISEQWSGL